MRLKKLDKIRLLVLLPMSLAFIVLGTIVYTSVQEGRKTNTSEVPRNLLNTTLEDDVNAFINSENAPIATPINNETTIAGVDDEIGQPEAANDDSDDADAECEPMREYCDPPGANLLDDVFFNQSNDGSFENPICTVNQDGSYGGKGCDAVGQQHTYYQADRSALLPINSRAFFTSGANYDKPEYIIQEVAGNQQCEEKLTAHGNNAYKIFSRQGYALRAGLCLPMKPHGNPTHSGINFRVSQATKNISDNVEVVFRLGYTTAPMTNNFYYDSTPSLQESDITWSTSRTVGQSEYGQEEGFAARYAGGFLETTLPGNATGFCFMAQSDGGVGINTFWDAAFASIDSNSCDIATEHKDGIDRSCGGYVCGGEEPVISGNDYVDFNQEYYAYDMPENWRATQCHYETETNGAESEYGTVYAGLDLNSCDPNYHDPAQRNLHPEMDKPDVACSDIRNWTFGYAWIGGIKDFGLLQYLDCALTNQFKGTDSNPFFCDQVLKSYSNSIDMYNDDDPAFTIRYSNTYSGLVNATLGEAGGNFWKVPLLGSAVSSGTINNRQVTDLDIDPYLIGKRNSGSGLNNIIKFNLEDSIISEILRREDHLYDSSIVTRNEVLMDDLLANGPVCSDIEGDPITKIHYGPSQGPSDRAIFGFADDEGSFEHIIHAENNDITTRQLCDFQLLEDRVEGADCTIDGITFTEGNINQTLEQANVMRRITAPTYPPPMEPGIPLDPNFDTCPEETFCGESFGCGDSMVALYNTCKASIDEYSIEITGNPFIKHVQPDPWENLQVFGLNKVMDSSWHNEFIQYNMPIRHENVGIDVNQVISLYDQQQPKCSIMPENRRPVYCTDDPVVNKAQQVCRRVPPYNCNCNATNFTTCLLDCKQNFNPPPTVEDVGLPIEGTVIPTLPPGPGVEQPLDTSIRSIIENDRGSFLERFVGLLNPKTYPGEGAENYEEGQVFSYDPRYTGGFLLANTGGEATQCTTQTGPRAAESVSQVRIENYFAYAGQLARMNERIGFAATNNKDPRSFRGETIDLENASVAELISYFVVRGEGLENIAIPYCDSLTEEEKSNCAISEDQNCDCLIRSCQQQYDTKISDMKTYLPIICEKLTNIPENEYHQRPVSECMGNLSTHWIENIFKPAKERCDATPKTNLNFNCDPMANYLINQGFDSAELKLAACDDIINNLQCQFDKFGVHLITGPLQPSNYQRTETLGLKWKMEVIVDDSGEMVDAMAESVDSFSGQTVFRFCNADQGEPGSKIQDQSCQFRTELTGSSSQSGRKAAEMILRVAEKTSKPFYVSPINEPVSEHWFGGDLNDDSNPTTMQAASEFYQAFAEVLNANQSLRSKIQIGGPTYNVTAFGKYENFEKFHNEFSAKDVVDYWTINIYNHDDLPAEINKLETQYEHVKTIFNDGKFIGINETGDFQHNLSRLRESFNIIGKDNRLRYALLFNAFGGWGDDRGLPLVLSDAEINTILSGNGVCEEAGGGNNVCVEGGILGLIKTVTDEINSIKPQIVPEILYGLGINEGFGGGLSGDPNEVKQSNATLGNDANNDGMINPPCTQAYPETDKDEIFTKYGCEYDVRGVMQFQNFTFYSIISNHSELMESCVNKIGIDFNVGSNDPGLDAVFQANGQNNSTGFSRARVGDNICAAAIFVASIGKNENGGIDVTPEEWENIAMSYVTGNNSNLIFQVAARYLGANDSCGPYAYCNKVTLDTKEAFENNIFDNISSTCEVEIGSPECLVNPMNKPQVITQCYGNTTTIDSSNRFCMDTFGFTEDDLRGNTYESLGAFHSAIDLVNNNDRTVFASGKGTVHTATNHKDYGNYVVIEHTLENSATTFYTRYAHLDQIDVTVGQMVDHKTKVGVMGSTGNSPYGAHLHFELLKFDTPQTTVYTQLNSVSDPTQIILRERGDDIINCTLPTTDGDLELIGTSDGITRYALGDLLVLKIDKNKYLPSLEWDVNGADVTTWANRLGTPVTINAGLFENNSAPFASTGKLKIKGNIIQPNTHPNLISIQGKGMLTFNSNDMSINRTEVVNINTFQNALESVPIMILNNNKYTSNTIMRRRHTAVGYDNSGNYIVVISNIEGRYSYSDTATLLLESSLGIKSLMGLDSGTSTGIVINVGSPIDLNATTGRTVPNVLTFKKK